MCNATSLTPKEDEQDGYQFYTRVLAAGDVAPSFSPEEEEHTTISIQYMINRQVSTSFVRQEDSMSSSLSLLALSLLTSLCMVLLSLTALLKGLLAVLAKMVSSAISKRPRSPHRGALGFLGPRSSHTVAQPKPLEGDVTSFWYYRKRLDQVWWGKSSKP